MAISHGSVGRLINLKYATFPSTCVRLSQGLIALDFCCCGFVDNIAPIFALLIDTARLGRVAKLSAAMAQYSMRLHASQAGIARSESEYTARKGNF